MHQFLYKQNVCDLARIIGNFWENTSSFTFYIFIARNNIDILNIFFTNMVCNAKWEI